VLEVLVQQDKEIMAALDILRATLAGAVAEGQALQDLMLVQA
jgi:hypothetical protein